MGHLRPFSVAEPLVLYSVWTSWQAAPRWHEGIMECCCQPQWISTANEQTLSRRQRGPMWPLSGGDIIWVGAILSKFCLKNDKIDSDSGRCSCQAIALRTSYRWRSACITFILFMSSLCVLSLHRHWDTDIIYRTENLAKGKSVGIGSCLPNCLPINTSTMTENVRKKLCESVSLKIEMLSPFR